MAWSSCAHAAQAMQTDCVHWMALWAAALLAGWEAGVVWVIKVCELCQKCLTGILGTKQSTVGCEIQIDGCTVKSRLLGVLCWLWRYWDRIWVKNRYMAFSNKIQALAFCEEVQEALLSGLFPIPAPVPGLARGRLNILWEQQCILWSTMMGSCEIIADARKQLFLFPLIFQVTV